MAPNEQVPMSDEVNILPDHIHDHLVAIDVSLKQIKHDEDVALDTKSSKLLRIAQHLEQVADEVDGASAKIQELEAIVETQDHEAREWKHREGHILSQLVKKDTECEKLKADMQDLMEMNSKLDMLRVALEEKLRHGRAKGRAEGDMKKKKLDSIRKQLAIMTATMEETE